ncbi:MAG: hypothetical protein ABI920_13185 [Casimicrobiaceae bacterium]
MPLRHPWEGPNATAIRAFLRQPAIQAKLQDRGVIPVAPTPKEFAQAMQDEFELYRKVVKDIGIKPN